jgi:hypothetical protein
LLALAACSRQDAKPDDIPEVAPESVPVLAVLELPSGRSLGTAAQVVDAVRPGAAKEAAASISTMLANAAEVGSLNGADLDKPVRALVLDPSKHPKPVLLLIRVSNAGNLATAVGKERLLLRNDLALVGAPEAARAAHDYAFGTLARREAPAGPQATIYVQPVRDLFLGAMLEMMGHRDSDRLFNFCIDRVLAVTEQTERVEAHVATQGALSGVELIVHARPETLFARFNQAQAPSDLALVEMLPAHEAPIMLMAGSLAMGPARQAFHDTGNSLMAAMWGLATTEEMGDWFGPYMDLFTGRFATSIRGADTMPQIVQLTEAKPGAQVASHAWKLMETVAAKGVPPEMMGMKQTISFTPAAFMHDGVTVMMQQTRTEMALPADGQAAQIASAFESKSYFAEVDGFLGMAMGEERNMRELIDAVRGKASRLQLGGALSRAMIASRARKDSAMVFMNLSALLGEAAAGMPQIVVITFGFEQTRMRVFLATVR